MKTLLHGWWVATILALFYLFQYHYFHQFPWNMNREVNLNLLVFLVFCILSKLSLVLLMKIFPIRKACVKCIFISICKFLFLFYIFTTFRHLCLIDPILNNLHFKIISINNLIDLKKYKNKYTRAGCAWICLIWGIFCISHCLGILKCENFARKLSKIFLIGAKYFSQNYHAEIFPHDSGSQDRIFLTLD